MVVDIYKELSLLDLTDKDNKFNLLKYLLLTGYIKDLNTKSKYKVKGMDEGWLLKFVCWHHIASEDLLTPDQWNEIADWVWTLIPDEIKNLNRFSEPKYWR